MDLQECASAGAIGPGAGHEVSRTLVAGLLNDFGDFKTVFRARFGADRCKPIYNTGFR